MSAVLLTLLGVVGPLLSQAEEAFTEGVALRSDPARARVSFRRAADLYEQVRRAEGLSSAGLFLNQGNACLLAAELPGAILAYRCGRRLKPQDRALQAQLAFAREQVVYPQPGYFARPPVEHRPPWLPRLPVGMALAASAVLHTIGCVAATRARIRPRARARVVAWVALPLAGIVLGALLLEEGLLQGEERQPLVVVAQDGVLLRKGNGEAYPRRSEVPLNRGVEARLLHERGDWVQIELSGREVGWVPREYVLIDRP